MGRVLPYRGVDRALRIPAPPLVRRQQQLEVVGRRHRRLRW